LIGHGLGLVKCVNGMNVFPLEPARQRIAPVEGTEANFLTVGPGVNGGMEKVVDGEEFGTYVKGVVCG